MPPRHQTLPSAQMSAAREAKRAFYCDLCSKGYSRMNDYEAHLSSYDHSHKQRLRDMKAMVRDPAASSRARKAEAKADGLVSIKLASQDGASGGQQQGGSSGGFKKGGFKKSGFKSAFSPAGIDQQHAAAVQKTPDAAPSKLSLVASTTNDESDTEDEGYEVYDPRFPTD
ncbi:Zinc-finger double-stranded RNA-binding [Geosmithia morbida]|uniref:Zinc-finger double-stranded RNA-binding n=1 Tax=Geosmithia morbida TaxID=1094350 RepID=A0A9P4YR14_9HYPO|nr:Zinc-finger double-stranded RNA-binding [Geosmithia morbida]KAF4119459.1 Zinc-finger double-stranded RNA-binding [Geosmithia morbida]